MNGKRQEISESLPEMAGFRMSAECAINTRRAMKIIGMTNKSRYIQEAIEARNNVVLSEDPVCPYSEINMLSTELDRFRAEIRSKPTNENFPGNLLDKAVHTLNDIIHVCTKLRDALLRLAGRESGQ